MNGDWKKRPIPGPEPERFTVEEFIAWLERERSLATMCRAEKTAEVLGYVLDKAREIKC